MTNYQKHREKLSFKQRLQRWWSLMWKYRDFDYTDNQDYGDVAS